MTQTRFEMILTGMAFLGSAAMWAAAWNLAGPVGRNRLTFGAPRLAASLRSRLGRDGKHVSASGKDEPATYDGMPVRGLSKLTEDERAARYAQMRAEAAETVASVSAAPYVDFTAELRQLTEADFVPATDSPALAALRQVIHLQEELAGIEASYRMRIDNLVQRARHDMVAA